MGKTQDTYYLDRVMEFPNATFKVYRPVLTEEERAIRMKRIHDAAVALVLDAYRNKEAKEDGN